MFPLLALSLGSALAFSTSQDTNAANQKLSGSVPALFVQKAKTCWFKTVDSVPHVILDGVSGIITQFSDRPFRMETKISTTGFMGNFPSFFGTDMPNTAFAFSDADDNDKILVASITPATVEGHMAFKLAQSPEQAAEASVQPLIGSSFALCVAFIDPSTSISIDWQALFKAYEHNCDSSKGKNYGCDEDSEYCNGGVCVKRGGAGSSCGGNNDCAGVGYNGGSDIESCAGSRCVDGTCFECGDWREPNYGCGGTQYCNGGKCVDKKKTGESCGDGDCEKDNHCVNNICHYCGYWNNNGLEAHLGCTFSYHCVGGKCLDNEGNPPPPTGGGGF